MWSNRDGTRTALLTLRPTRYRDETGWHDFDLSLVPGPDASLQPKAAGGGLRFSRTAAGDVARIDTPAGPVALRHPGATPPPP